MILDKVEIYTIDDFKENYAKISGCDSELSQNGVARLAGESPKNLTTKKRAGTEILRRADGSIITIPKRIARFLRG